MKKIVAAALAAALMLLCLTALGEETELTPVELNVDSLEYVDETHYLIARDADSRLYGLYNTDGEMLIPCEYGLLAYADYGFFEAINEDGLNTHALLRADGQAVTGWEYAAFEILNEKWGLAVTLEPTESEDYWAAASTMWSRPMMCMIWKRARRWEAFRARIVIRRCPMATISTWRTGRRSSMCMTKP